MTGANSSVGMRALAERVEAATGPDRELDFDIAEAIRLTTENEFGDTVLVARDSGFKPPHSFTTSLDAAMTLVPEGWVFGVVKTYGHCLGAVGGKFEAIAATPPMALCAAALKARAHAGAAR